MIAPKNNTATTTAKPKTAANAPASTPSQNKLISLMNHPEIQQRLKALLSDKKMLDGFVGVITGVLRTNPKLAECTEASFLSAMIKSATLKLIPNDPILQQCWLIPRKSKNTGKLECTWEAGWKGLIELGYRSDEVDSIAFAEIYERDYFDVDWGINHVSHKLPTTGGRFNRGEVEAFWAQWVGKDGARGKPVIMTYDQMNAHAEQYVESLDSDYSPWNTAFNEMALKTVIKRAMKTAPMSNDDLRQGLDESPPQDNPRYAPPAQVTASPSQGFADPMFPTEQQSSATTVDAEYENIPEQKAPSAEPEPTPAEPKPDPEQERLAMVSEVEKRIQLAKDSGMDQAVLVSKLGMAPSMVKKASMDDLIRMAKAIKV